MNGIINWIFCVDRPLPDCTIFRGWKTIVVYVTTALALLILASIWEGVNSKRRTLQLFPLIQMFKRKLWLHNLISFDLWNVSFQWNVFLSNSDSSPASVCMIIWPPPCYIILATPVETWHFFYIYASTQCTDGLSRATILTSFSVLFDHWCHPTVFS